MSPNEISAAANALFRAWNTGELIGLPSDVVAPRSLDDSASIQDELAAKLGFEWVGWKLGLTSPAGQAAAGFDRPFTGRLFRDSLKQSPARFLAGSFSHPLAEAEIGFRLSSPLPPRHAPYSRDEVVAAVEEMFFGVEIADTRFDSDWPIAIPLLAADNGATGAYVIGPSIRDWVHLPLETLDVTLSFDGVPVAKTFTGDFRTPAVATLVWGVNELSRRGIGVKAHEIISTGAACVPTPVPPGTHVTARFGGIL